MSGSNVAPTRTGSEAVASPFTFADYQALRDEYNKLVDVVDLLVHAEGAGYQRNTDSGLAGLAAPASSAIQLTTGLTYHTPDGALATLTSDDLWAQSTLLTALTDGQYNVYYLEATSDSTPAAIREGTAATALVDVAPPVPSTVNALIGVVQVLASTAYDFTGNWDSTAFDEVNIFDGPQWMLETLMDRVGKVSS